MEIDDNKLHSSVIQRSLELRIISNYFDVVGGHLESAITRTPLFEGQPLSQIAFEISNFWKFLNLLLLVVGLLAHKF